MLIVHVLHLVEYLHKKNVYCFSVRLPISVINSSVGNFLMCSTSRLPALIVFITYATYTNRTYVDFVLKLRILTFRILHYAGIIIGAAMMLVEKSMNKLMSHQLPQILHLQVFEEHQRIEASFELLLQPYQLQKLHLLIQVLLEPKCQPIHAVCLCK